MNFLSNSNNFEFFVGEFVIVSMNFCKDLEIPQTYSRLVPHSQVVNCCTVPYSIIIVHSEQH